MECPGCQHVNPAGEASCLRCGTPLSCARCSEPLMAGSRFCGQCGAPVAAPRKRSIEHDERRLLTVMFCDLADSTVLSQRLDPEDLLDVMRRYQGAIARTVERYGGHVAQYLGDGVLVYFGYPRAYEDDARRAVTSGLEILEAVEGLNEELERDHGVRLAMRAGMHTGPVVAGEVGAGARTEQLAMGATPNVAARVQALAKPGELLLTQDSYALAERFFECQSLGPSTLRGLSEPVVLYRAIQARSAERRDEHRADADAPPFVGREPDLERLLAALDRAEQGEGQVVLVCGEPGIGKTRLQQELARRTAGRTAAWLGVTCSAYHQNSALYPVTEQLTHTIGLKPGEPTEGSLDKLETWLESLELVVEEMAPPLAALLSLPTDRYEVAVQNPERQRKQLLGALIALVRHLARSKPVVLAMEDLQWADPSTQELLAMLATEIEREKVLAIFALRPEAVPAWSALPGATRIDLGRLAQRDAEAMLDGWVTLPPPLRREVLARTDGIPLFLEELTQAVRADAAKNREVPGNAADAEPLIPTTLRSSLMARLDSLGPAKETAQLASVLGRTFHHDVLSAVSAAETELVDAHIGSLLEAGLLEDVVSPPDGTYRFRQSLLQETAYESLLRSRRRELHGHVANVLSERFAALTGSEPETLARHCEAAGRWRDALDSYRNAGNRGVERGSYVEAIAIFQKSVELLDRLEAGTDRDRLELALLQQAVMPIFAHHGYAASELPGIYARIGELTRALGGSREEAWQLVAAWGFHLVRCDRLETQELAERMKELAKHAPEVLGNAQLGYVLGYNAFYAGDQVRAQAELERALQPGEGGSGSPVPAIEAAFHCSLARGWSLAVTGEAEPAWQAVSASVAAAEAVGQPFAVAQALAYQSAVAQETGREPREVKELAERLLKIATEQDLTIWIYFAHIFRGWARAMEGEEDGVGELRDAIEASLAGGHLTSMGHSLLLQASALQHLGRSEEALRTVDEALAFAADHLERFSESDAMRVRGELLWETGDRDAAEDSLRAALETASKQGARLFALRAATSLARLLQEKDRRDEGCACLAPWVRDFPDGLPGPWLHEAKELLSHLDGAA